MPEAKKREVRKAIDKALAKSPVFQITGELAKRAVGQTDKTDVLHLKLHLAEYDRQSQSNDNVKLVPVLVQRTTRTTPRTGWNKGKTLVDHFVVIDVLQQLDPGDAMGEEPLVIDFELPDSANLQDYGVAVLLENQKTGDTLESRMFFLPDEK